MQVGARARARARVQAVPDLTYRCLEALEWQRRFRSQVLPARRAV